MSRLTNLFGIELTEFGVLMDCNLNDFLTLSSDMAEYDENYNEPVEEEEEFPKLSVNY